MFASLFTNVSFNLFLLTLEEEKTEKRKEQKRKASRRAYRKKMRANGFAPAAYRRGDQKLTRAEISKR